MANGSISVQPLKATQQQAKPKAPLLVDVSVTTSQNTTQIAQISTAKLTIISSRFAQAASSLPVNAANGLVWRLSASDVDRDAAYTFLNWAKTLDLTTKHEVGLNAKGSLTHYADIHRTLLFLEIKTQFTLEDYHAKLFDLVKHSTPSADELVSVYRSVLPSDGLRRVVADRAVQFTTTAELYEHYQSVFTVEQTLLDDYINRYQNHKKWLARKERNRQANIEASKATKAYRKEHKETEVEDKRADEIRRELASKGSGLNSLSYEKAELLRKQQQRRLI